MGKKYIIELEEPEIFDEWKYYQCSQMPWLAVSENVVENLTPYTEPDLEKIKKEAYEQGRKDGKVEGRAETWVCVKKIAYMDSEKRKKIFGENLIRKIPDIYSASEAIEKIRQYEQEQDAEIKVGDEVCPREAEYDDMIVTRLWKDDYDSDCIDAIGFDGRIGSFLVSRVSKTGKHYEISEVLRKMRESE